VRKLRVKIFQTGRTAVGVQASAARSLAEGRKQAVDFMLFAECRVLGVSGEFRTSRLHRGGRFRAFADGEIVRIH